MLKLLEQKYEVFAGLRDAYKAGKTKKDKEEFKSSLKDLINSLSESIKKSGDRLKTLSKSVEEEGSKLSELQSYENKYMKLIKEYNKEYNILNSMNLKG